MATARSGRASRRRCGPIAKSGSRSRCCRLAACRAPNSRPGASAISGSPSPTVDDGGARSRGAAMLAGLALLIPTAADLAGLARALLTGLVFWGCGRWAVRDAALEVQIVAGWGAACIALTVWGALLPLSLAIPGAAVAAAGGAGLALRRPAADEWRAVARIVVLAAPVLLL